MTCGLILARGTAPEAQGRPSSVGRSPRSKRPSWGILGAVAAVLASPAWAQDAIVYPDPSLTPGAVRTTDPAEICGVGTRQYRHYDPDRADRIYASYHIARADRIKYTLDHLIPLEGGGADVAANIWPEPRASLAGEWDDFRKDQLERTLARMICSGQIPVQEAQRAIAEDWPSAYLRFVEGQPAANVGPARPVHRLSWAQRLRG